MEHVPSGHQSYPAVPKSNKAKRLGSDYAPEISGARLVSTRSAWVLGISNLRPFEKEAVNVRIRVDRGPRPGTLQVWLPSISVSLLCTPVAWAWSGPWLDGGPAPVSVGPFLVCLAVSPKVRSGIREMECSRSWLPTSLLGCTH